MLGLIIANTIWILYSILEGLREGFYWHFKSGRKNSSLLKPNYLSLKVDIEIHPLFALQRGLMLLSTFGFMYYTIGLAQGIISSLCLMLIFSFFHNGMYYLVRNKLNKSIYPLRWMDQSTESTAKMTKIMTYKNRTIFMILGVLIEAFICIFYL